MDERGNILRNKCADDRLQKIISEFIRISLGLKFAVINFEINSNRFKKINAPVDGKYLDYSWNKEKKNMRLKRKELFRRRSAVLRAIL
ncbi:hypothetical protein LEP1GSC161_0302 [Leptospira santarosai str. CBC1416]|uniref:Uncharacterized protein n=1 Tax=Leptospira santarosai str. CBC1416 TaxID=1193059 RepID=M6VIQ5_9LEPT|nr:hypothetical protein LEP1GSC161_0302 [Leptospira santarosai str. CBC1416]